MPKEEQCVEDTNLRALELMPEDAAGSGLPEGSTVELCPTCYQNAMAQSWHLRCPEPHCKK